MKRAAPTTPEPRPRSGPPLAAIAGAVSLMMGSFLLLGPGCERDSDASSLGDEGATPEQVERAVLRLCASRAGRDQMVDRLGKLGLEARLPLLELTSAKPDCFSELPGSFRAEHELWSEDSTPALTIAIGADAIEPALTLVSKVDGERRRYALVALVVLSEEMSEDQKQRAIKRVTPLTETDEFLDRISARALLTALGVEPPAEAASAGGADEVEEAEDYELGDPGLRLQLGGSAPAAPPRDTGGGILLREPSLDLGASRPKGGVLFDASKEN